MGFWLLASQFIVTDSFNIQAEVKVKSREDLHELELSDTRIILLYSTRQEGSQIMRWAREAGLTGNSFVWIATQSVIGETKEALPDFPSGMLGEVNGGFSSSQGLRMSRVDRCEL